MGYGRHRLCMYNGMAGTLGHEVFFNNWTRHSHTANAVGGLASFIGVRSCNQNEKVCSRWCMTMSRTC